MYRSITYFLFTMGNLLLYILAIIVFPFYLIWQLIVYIYRFFKPKPTPKPTPKPYTATIYYYPFTTLPFTILENQIVYTEGSYNEEVNNFIQQNYDKICARFKYSGYEFCYIPYMAKQTEINIEDDATPYEVSIEDLIITSDQLTKILIGERAITKGPQLMFYCSHFKEDNEPDKSILKLIDIDLSQLSPDMHEILDVIKRQINNSKPTIRYSLCDNHSMLDTMKTTYPDEKDEVWQLINEIESRVEHLANKGVDEKILHQIVAKPEVVSRMIITRDYRIILPDYDDMEINMTPLVKAVYLLFLRHPDGIILKHLEDYRKELIEIYSSIKGLPLDEKMMQSVVDVTNPLSNSINEKVARIREAFVTRFKEGLATNYIIHGGRGETKRIPLHREFVVWQ